MKRNNTYCVPKVKASLTACLFLFSVWLPAQTTNLSGASFHGYDAVLDLQLTGDYPPAPSYSADQLYVHALSEALELLLTEDPAKFKLYESRADDRIDILDKKQDAAALFVMAEIRLQWSFVHLKFGDELDAAWDLRQSYLLSRLCKKKYPDFTPIYKTSGILNIMIGSVPEKYDWILSLLGMEGDVSIGVAELERVQQADNVFSKEARLLKSLIEGYVFQHPDTGLQNLAPLLAGNSTPSLALVLATSLCIKNAQSEEALKFINQLEEKKIPVNLAFIRYLKGEVYLHKGQYRQAVEAYQQFTNNFAGSNHLKDACYKTGVAYWLDHDDEKANAYFVKAISTGKEETEADKYAARSLQSPMPNRKLTRIRYFTDGGYYEAATKEFESIAIQELTSEKERVEFYYRKARLAHRTNSTEEAIRDYMRTITLSTSLQTYFAPNACLQLGYLYLDRKDFINAERYFKKALTYKRHEYKNSIDSKARSALAQLKATK